MTMKPKNSEPQKSPTPAQVDYQRRSQQMVATLALADRKPFVDVLTIVETPTVVRFAK